MWYFLCYNWVNLQLSAVVVLSSIIVFYIIWHLLNVINTHFDLNDYCCMQTVVSMTIWSADFAITDAEHEAML